MVVSTIHTHKFSWKLIEGRVWVNIQIEQIKDHIHNQTHLQY